VGRDELHAAGVVNEQSIRIEAHVTGSKHQVGATFTVINAASRIAPDLEMRIHRESVHGESISGPPRILLGDPRFDDIVTLQASDALVARVCLAPLRDAILGLPEWRGEHEYAALCPKTEIAARVGVEIRRGAGSNEGLEPATPTARPRGSL
jgi:hypothetical protein